VPYAEAMRTRTCLPIHGTPEHTAAEADRLVAGLDDVLRVGPDDTAPRAVRDLLGRSFDAVVLDLHTAIDADVIGQCQGFIRGGGALILRLSHDGIPGGDARLAAFPYTTDDVTRRFAARFEARLPAPTLATQPLPPTDHATQGTFEQAEMVAQLRMLLTETTPQAAVIIADRGRGKSSALGLTIRGSALRVGLAAGRVDAAAEVVRFAANPDLPFYAPLALALAPARLDALIIDEAAQVPVPVLQRIVQQHPDTHLIFATTARGYEGTGRGFLLRFVEWLSDHRTTQRFSLHAPIRWASGDPLERLVFDALLLDALPATVERVGFDVDAVEPVILDRATLSDAQLRQFFGLMVHAHYRTTPGDLHRMLDAPNVRLHALLYRGDVVAATMVALEGELPAETADAIHRGRTRVRGHALPETLASHAARPDAAQMAIVRSVRIAVHPALRRLGLGTRLIDHVHASYTPDLFGTLFGATADLLTFRRVNGYRLVRVGASRGTRTGEPAAVMIRPVTARADALLADLRADLARDLPLQLELMQAGDELLLGDAMHAALTADLPAPAPMDDARRDAIVHTFTHGPRTHEAAAVALEAYTRAHADALDRIEPQYAALVRARILERNGWAQAMRIAGLPSLPATMRALRRAMRALVGVC
jgi:tRNA(Met) cytidine acetyltransferase